ncbi:molecular chaperone [Bradyrhizobium tropiciagri]|uniref:molecular chaperone n=1 Tax=Bradyrhizobium tropiciagri TaxID=312253 RepID=UPI001BACD854|nr:molecular chaperone [Bradyrhizobium tropiciagri]MBR0871226.1 molecular chaperone [Bradyrhizobium tropiciagri]
MPERLTKRGGLWYYVRRVPPEFAAFDARDSVRISTRIKVRDDRTGVRAARVATQLDIDQEAAWKAAAGQGARQAAVAFDDAWRRAQALDLPYKPIEEIAKETADEILRRFDTLAVGERRHDLATVDAALGGVPTPQILLSGLYDEFEIAKKTTIAKMSEGQVKKWRNGKKRAVEVLINVVGDRSIRLSHEDALKYVDFWTERVVDGEVQAGTANRNLTHITGMLTAVSRRHRLRLDRVFAGLRLEEEEVRPRPPFSAWWIVNRLLTPGALATMNAEERAVVLIMVNTGARPSEIINLQPDRILLESEIPHIQVRPDDRVLKTASSYRDIPLVGISLEAMKLFPRGFSHYRDNGDALSAAVNAYFTDHKLRETERHTLYSLRHGFKDRLREVEASDELKDELMGHDTKKPKYGDGHGLRLKLKYIEMIALAGGMTVARPLQLVKASA